jgi:hypothetical protein
MAGLLTCDKLLLKFLDYIHCLLFQTKHNIQASWGSVPCQVVNSYVPEELAAAIYMVFAIQEQTHQSKENILITVQVNQSSRTIIYWYHILPVEITGNLQQSEKPTFPTQMEIINS